MQPTTFFLVDQQPPQQTTQQAQEPPQPDPARRSDMKSSWSSLLDSDTESIISGSEYSPPLSASPGVRSLSEERRSFESFVGGSSSTAATFEDVFSRRHLNHEEDSDSESNSAHGRVPLSLSNSTTFAAALGKPSSQKFVMPRVAMPARRPFTPEGLTIGKLKLLVAGDSGTGKTSFINALAATSDHVVYIDEASTPVPTTCSDSLHDNLDQRPEHQNAISELLASTRPMLAFQDPSASRRDSSTTATATSSSDLVALDRNICFVDTIGYGNFTNAVNCIKPVLEYIECTFERTLDLVNPTSHDALGILASTGVLTEGALVDVCLYCVVQRLKPVDVEYMRRLSEYIPVVPVITKADICGDDLAALKSEIVRQVAQEAFWFGQDPAEILAYLGQASGSSKDTISPRREQEHPADSLVSLLPPAVSTSQVPDTETLASLLMSSTYTPPLGASDLRAFAFQVLSADGAAWLRYTAARKFLTWTAKHRDTQTGLFSAQRYLTPGAVLENANPVIVSSHGSNEHQQQLVPVGTDRALACCSPATTDEPDLVVNLSEHALRQYATQAAAQTGTSRWVNSLAESTNFDSASSGPLTSRPRNALAAAARNYQVAKTSICVRSHSRSQSRSLSPPTSSQARSNKPRSQPQRRRHSLSITNLDPLRLSAMTSFATRWAMRTVSLLLGIKVGMLLWSAWTTADGGCGSKSGPEVLGRLGGGWSVLL